MKNSSIALIAQKYQKGPTYSLHFHIQQTIKEILDFLIFYRESEENLLQKTNVLRFSEKVTSENTIRQSVFLMDDDPWRQNFELIIEGKWTLEGSPTSIVEYGLTLVGFYQRALHEDSISQNQLLALVLELEEKVRKMIYYGGISVAKHVPIANKLLLKYDKGVKRAKTKVIKDWSWMIGIIENLDSQGAYQECKTLNSVIQRTRDEMVLARAAGKLKPDLFSNDTIKRVFKQVFGIETKNYKQPLKLLKKV